jgi:hypothetical protein
MEHPDTKRHPAGVGQGCVRVDDVVTPTYVELGTDASNGLRCVGPRTDIVRTGIVNAKISERGA